jgi:uncharacterized protein (DUF362 family)
VGDNIQSGSEDGIRISGFRHICERVGVKLINLREAGFVETDCNGHLLDIVYISSAVPDANVIVNLRKPRTHSRTVLTGGVKNMYGVIPQGLRVRYHGQYVGNEDFSKMLTDILSVVRLTGAFGSWLNGASRPGGSSLRLPQPAIACPPLLDCP